MVKLWRLLDVLASMRPPEFTGGNTVERGMVAPRTAIGFNEAAGIHRRKRGVAGAHWTARIVLAASMRPPEFTGGNT